MTDIGSTEETKIAEGLVWPFLSEGDLLSLFGARSRRVEIGAYEEDETVKEHETVKKEDRDSRRDQR